MNLELKFGSWGRQESSVIGACGAGGCAPTKRDIPAAPSMIDLVPKEKNAKVRALTAGQTRHHVFSFGMWPEDGRKSRSLASLQGRGTPEFRRPRANPRVTDRKMLEGPERNPSSNCYPQIPRYKSATWLSPEIESVGWMRVSLHTFLGSQDFHPAIDLPLGATIAFVGRNVS